MKMHCKSHKHIGDQKVVDAIRSIVTLRTLHVGDHTYSPEALAGLFERRLIAAEAVDSARRFLIETEQVYEEIDAEAGPAMRDLKRMAIGLFGASGPVTEALGVRPPRKSAPWTRAQKLAALGRLATHAEAAVAPTLPSPQTLRSPQ